MKRLEQEAQQAYGVTRSNLAGTYNNLGNELHEEGKYEEAIAQCQQAIQLMPKMATAYNNFGRSLTALGSIDQAINVLQQAITLNPGYGMDNNNLGVAL